MSSTKADAGAAGDSWVAAEIPPAALLLVGAGLPRRLAELLALRGLTSAEAAAAFLEPRLEQLHPPHELAGLTGAVERLAAACRQRRRLAVVGDYDADGVSATALLVAVLRSAGAEAEPILVRRHEEGYGLQPQHAERAHEMGARLIVAVDCGTNARAAAEAARVLGLELIVVDHHLPDSGPALDAVLINPRQADCGYPFRELTGAGLALKLAAALLEALGRPVPWGALLRVACLGTIADVAPLVGENRVLAALGLAELARTRSAGLSALLAAAGVRAPLSAADVAFRLAPRLNAPGRLATADPALELLLARDPARARELAGALEAWNRQRQQLEMRVLDDARRSFETARGALAVAWSAEWNRGVVGIAAGRLARELGRPVVLLAAAGDTATGSGRSVPGVHLHDFLSPWAARLERFGGHAQAVGLTARLDRLPGLVREWDAAAPWRHESPAAEQRYDLELALEEVDDALLSTLARLAPYGPGNEEPRFRLGPLRTAAPPREFGDGHLALVLRNGAGARRPAVIWNWRRRERALPPSFEVLASVERDRWLEAPRLVVVDLRPRPEAAPH